MIKKMLQKVAKRFIRENQVGQSVVILALGMVGLLVVVGIAVDVSILFIRFSTLRRAVDSASIAAAGQMRQDRTLAEVGLAARQFIEFHDLNPRDVLVETCHTSQILDSGGAVQSEDPELCTADQRKLVRVTAEIDSPTVFLRLIGFGNITLRSSSVSETATLDVVLIMDVSESMLNETTYDDWADVNQGIAYVPPRLYHLNNFFGDPSTGTNDPDTVLGRGFISGTYDPAQHYTEIYDMWEVDVLGVTQEAVNRRLEYVGVGPGAAAGAPVHAIDQSAAAGGEVNPDYATGYFVPSGINGASQVHPRPACRVRFFPYSAALSVPDYLQDLYADNAIDYRDPAQKWGYFVPTFDFYGCCNDPGNGTQAVDGDGDPTHAIVPGNSVDADGDFSDLVCQPFRDARDATREFLQRIDFVRGDRVSFVTFDRSAFIIDPDGDGTDYNHMIEEEGIALDTLNRMIGVRAEPNFYDWDEAGGGWIAFSSGLDTDDDGEMETIDYYSLDPQAVNLNDYPVRNNCHFQNATLTYPFTRYATRGINGEIMPGLPWDGSPAIYNIMTPDIANGWNGTAQSVNPRLGPLNSYELWASCRGTNVGAALREANNALTDPTTSREEGTVWVMIFLGDGAAGASDPARRLGRNPDTPEPYFPISQGPLPTPYQYGLRGQYGAYGACPIGTQSQFGELLDTSAEPDIVFPFCSDEQPESRHFCYPNVRASSDQNTSVGAGGSFDFGFGPGAVDIDGEPYDLDVGDYPNFPGARAQGCIFYDVDDYARDWADYVGGIGDENASSLILPTIFTIGFGLGFDEQSPGDDNITICQNNIGDCLGEELLRYIADVGDNFEIDTNYQQDYLDNGFLDDSLSPNEYGQRGVCEPDNGYVSPSEVNFLTPGESCGNYFNAPTVDELEIVFDEIASRMFTRIAQ